MPTDMAIDYTLHAGESITDYNARIAQYYSTSPTNTDTSTGIFQYGGNVIDSQTGTSTPYSSSAVTTSTAPRDTLQQNISTISGYQPVQPITPPATTTTTTETPGSTTTTSGISQQDYQLKPGESTTDYNTRIAGLRSQQSVSSADALAALKKQQAEQSLASGDVTAFNTFAKQYQDAILQRDKYREDLIKAMQPSTQERDLQTQLLDIRNQANQLAISAQEGAQGEVGLGRPLQISVGRAEKVLQQGELRKQALAANEANIIGQLGLVQADRELAAKVANLGLQSVMEDADSAMKMYQLQDALEEKLYSRARDYQKDQKDALADVLENFSDVDPSTLDANTRTQISNALTRYGLDYSDVEPYLNAQWSRGELERYSKGLDIQTKELGLIRTSAEIAKLRAEAQGAGMTLENLIAYAQEYAANGKIPTGLPKGSFGAVAQAAKELPKPKGAVVDRNTGIKSSSVSATLEGAYSTLYSVVDLAKQLKELDEKRWGGVVSGTLGKIFGSEDQQRYIDLRDQISDLLARARTGAAINASEEARYYGLLPGRLDEPFGIGVDSQVRIDNFIDIISQDLQNKLDTQGLAIYGLSTVNVDGVDYTIGDVVENAQGQQGRINPDGSVTIIE